MPLASYLYFIPMLAENLSRGNGAEEVLRVTPIRGALSLAEARRDSVVKEARCNIQSKVKEAGQPREGRLIERQLICSRALPNVAQG
jgi:hypothetical protein